MGQIALFPAQWPTGSVGLGPAGRTVAVLCCGRGAIWHGAVCHVGRSHCPRVNSQTLIKPAAPAHSSCAHPRPRGTETRRQVTMETRGSDETGMRKWYPSETLASF
uniref:Uncharacterized protein n=1 Tax=Knipowitschia caucasica TaxID=637954 RepID=A0AAV2LX89_KNICA